MDKINIFDGVKVFPVSKYFKGKEYRDEIGGKNSDLWLEIFVEADKISPDLEAVLMYMRNAGCDLELNETMGYKIIEMPGYWQAGEYDREKQCLGKYRNEIIGLFRRMREHEGLRRK